MFTKCSLSFLPTSGYATSISMRIFFLVALLALPNAAKAKSTPDPQSTTSPFQVLEDVVGQSWTRWDLNDFGRDPNGIVDLLEYLRANVVRGSNLPDDYDRIVDFGTWVRPYQNDCRNMRAFVLIRDADPSVEVKYTAAGCSVSTGLWNDPYSGNQFKKARALDIDHMVPLHNAYQMGANRWTPPRRCHYANYMGNGIHLRAVASVENRSKGDNSPDAYMPSNTASHCEYVSNWMKIKAIWELSATRDEIAAIEEVFKRNRCQPSDNLLRATDLMNQRHASQQVSDVCSDFDGTLNAAMRWEQPTEESD